MYKYLEQHPEVFVPKWKEPNIFGTDLYCPYFLRDKEQYLALFAAVRGEKRLGEASAWYLYSKLAAVEIKEFSPTAKIIIMLRNPVDMIYSLHGELFYAGDEDIESFEAALEAESERAQGVRVPKNCNQKFALIYRDTAKYADQVRRYWEVFGGKNVCTLIFEELKSDPALAYRNVCEFLDIDSNYVPRFEVANSRKQIRVKALRSLFRDRPLIVRVLARILLPAPLRHRFVWALQRLNTRHVPAPLLRRELRKKLQTEFLPDVEKLSNLLGRDLTYWCRE